MVNIEQSGIRVCGRFGCVHSRGKGGEAARAETYIETSIRGVTYVSNRSEPSDFLDWNVHGWDRPAYSLETPAVQSASPMEHGLAVGHASTEPRWAAVVGPN